MQNTQKPYYCGFFFSSRFIAYKKSLLLCSPYGILNEATFVFAMFCTYNMRKSTEGRVSVNLPNICIKPPPLPLENWIFLGTPRKTFLDPHMHQTSSSTKTTRVRNQAEVWNTQISKNVRVLYYPYTNNLSNSKIISCLV